jgi:hypothetical protein
LLGTEGLGLKQFEMEKTLEDFTTKFRTYLETTDEVSK